MSAILDKFEIDISLVSSSKLKFDECRIDPKFFSANQNFINDLDTQPLESFCTEIFNPPVFKREFLEDENECRYLASAEIVSLAPEITYITNEQADRLRLRVKKNWILVTGFGTIGSIRLTDDIINGYAIANNVSRIIANKGYEGFIAAYLESSYGNKLLNDHAAGAVIKYIEAPHISKIPVPVLDEKTVKSIDEKYLSAVTCREKAHELLEKADSLVHQYNNLPPLSETNFETIDSSNETQIRLTNLKEFTLDYRLDAHFYNPVAEQSVSNIQTFSTRFESLFDVANCSFKGSRSTRNYVSKENGVPFLGGKNIIQIRPDFKYVSKTETNNLSDMIVEKNQILISRSGTLGRTVFVWKNYENCAASEHLIRVDPNGELIDGAYLYAFLSSDHGYHQLLRYKHGSVIDEITEDQISQSIIPIPSDKQQKEIGDLVRKAYDYRADAIRLEDDAQEILTLALTKNK